MPQVKRPMMNQIVRDTEATIPNNMILDSSMILQSEPSCFLLSNRYCHEREPYFLEQILSIIESKFPLFA